MPTETVAAHYDPTANSDGRGCDASARSSAGQAKPPWRLRALVPLAAAFFAIIALHRFEIIDAPPYTEQTLCLTEGDWLARHGYNLWRLRTDEPHFEDGGPRCYWCSVLPSLMGLAIQTLPTPQAVFVSHRLFYWAMAALLLVIACQLVRDVSNLWLGLLVVLAIYVTPLFSVQVEMLGMELPTAATAFLWWWAMDRRRFVAATLIAFVPFFFKPSAFIVPLAGACYFGALALLELVARGRLSSCLLRLSLANAAFFAIQMALFVFGGNLRGRVMILHDLDLWIKSAPDLIAFTAVAAILTLLLALYQFGASRYESAWSWRALLLRIDRFLVDNPTLASGWLVVFLNLFAAAGTYYESRHLTLVVPMVLVLLARACVDLQWRTGVVAAGCGALVVFQAANQYGRFYPKLQGAGARGWGVLERSLEYRVDHHSNIAACRLIDERLRGQPLLVADGFLYFLKLRSMGYVRAGMAEGDYHFIARDADMLRIFDDRPETINVVHVTNQHYAWPFPAYAISPPDEAEGDEVLYDDKLRPPVIIYRRSFARFTSPSDRMRAYADLLFHDARDVDPAVRLAVVGSARLARQYLLAEQPSLDGAAVDRELTRRVRNYLTALNVKLQSQRHDFFTPRIQRVVQRRLESLETNRPLEPLAWHERTVRDTWPQRLAYFSAEQTRLPR
jgi:hypothetical protein